MGALVNIKMGADGIDTVDTTERVEREGRGDSSAQ